MCCMCWCRYMTLVLKVKLEAVLPCCIVKVVWRVLKGIWTFEESAWLYTCRTVEPGCHMNYAMLHLKSWKEAKHTSDKLPSICAHSFTLKHCLPAQGTHPEWHCAASCSDLNPARLILKSVLAPCFKWNWMTQFKKMHQRILVLFFPPLILLQS